MDGAGKMKRYYRLPAAVILSAVVIQCAGSIPVMAASGLAIDKNNFPDANFRAVISGSDYDSDGNGYLSDYEISRIINVDCEGCGVKSLKGIEHFSALQGLWCKDNDLTSIDVSKNKDLRGVWCSGNDITSLDFSNNKELAWVYCFDCKLKSINVTKNEHLSYLEINNNPDLKSLNLSGNPELEHLMCVSCGLTSLDLSNNPLLAHLDAQKNKLKSLTFDNNKELRRLDIWENRELSDVDVSGLKGLQYYNCAYNNVTKIDVTHNPELQKLICSYNDITKLDISKNPKLAYLDCACNEISSLDISHNPQLYFLQAFTNTFTKIDITNNSRLQKTYNDGVKKAEYAVCKGHSWSINYGGWTELGVELLYFFCVDDTVKVTGAKSKGTDKPDSYIKINDGLSSSSDLITREMAIETLYKLAGSPSVSGLSHGFKDIPSGASYEDAVKWGVANNVCFGYPNICSDTFGVGQPVTREDLALMMHKFSAVMGFKTGFDYGRTDWFKDYYDIDYYCWGAFTWSIQWEFLTPKGDYLYPHGRVTRNDFKNAINELYRFNYRKAPSNIPIPQKTGWVKDSKGWWYRNPDGSYPKACWKKISEKWYYFNDDGYIVTGWKKINNKWYYFNPDGDMVTGWKLINSKWYYFNSEGAMVTGWKAIGGKWYFFRPDGDMVTGWLASGGSWYHLASSGEMQTGWKYIDGDWYYFYSSGIMAYNTTIDGYHLGASGAMD